MLILDKMFLKKFLAVKLLTQKRPSIFQGLTSIELF